LPGETDLGSYIQAYDRAIRAWDDSFGDWIAWLDAREGGPEPLVAVIADHGEEFVERGNWSHGETLYEEQVWVPWLIRVPGRAPARVSDQVVSLIDFAPTLLSALELPVPDTMIGSDVLGADVAPDRTLFSETDVRIGGIVDSRFVQRAVRRGDTKYIQRPTGPECYELEGDRSEGHSICASASWQKRAEADIERWNAGNEVLAGAMGEAPSVVLDAEQRERLKAIGYIQ
jgi:arylsulfatase A-like enzyme